jgi:hypothetical protein
LLQISSSRSARMQVHEVQGLQSCFGKRLRHTFRNLTMMQLASRCQGKGRTWGHYLTCVQFVFVGRMSSRWSAVAGCRQPAIARRLFASGGTAPLGTAVALSAAPW